MAKKRSPAKAKSAELPKSQVDLDDERLARQYKTKQNAGQPTTRQERAAFKRWEKRAREDLQRANLQHVPQKLYREMSGRQPKVLYEQAQRTGIPFDRAEVNLFDVVRALHDFLAAKKHLLWKPGDDEDEVAMLGESSPALERWREEKYLLARLDRLERERQLFPRHVVHEALQRIAALFRNAGDQFQQISPDAVELLNETLDNLDRVLAELFDDLDRHADDSPDAEGDPPRPA